MERRTIKLTQRAVQDLPCTGKDYKVFDSQLQGFHVRVHPSGIKTYALFYRSHGQQRTIALGKCTVLKAEQARNAAIDHLAKIQKGADPSAELKSERRAHTVAELFEEYLQKHALPRKSPRSVEGDKILWRLHLKPRFGGMRIDAIGPREFDRFVADMACKPGAANRSLALLSKMMSLAVRWEYRSDNPVATVQRYPENKVERYLTTNEAKALWAALDADDDRAGAVAIKLLLLTGARRGEVLRATWDQFSLSPEQAEWVVPSEHLKGATRVRSALRRPLSPEAAEILRSWMEASHGTGPGYLFPNSAHATRPRPDLKAIWSRVRNCAGLTDVRLHDLRHTYASMAVQTGSSLRIIGKALGHRDVRTTDRYAHVNDASIRAASSGVSTLLGV